MTKLGLKIVRGQFALQTREVPDLEVAKKLWREGKTYQEIIEISKRQRKKKAA